MQIEAGKYYRGIWGGRGMTAAEKIKTIATQIKTHLETENG